MATKKINQVQASELECRETVTLDDGTKLEFIERGDWEDEGKYSNNEVIAKDQDGNFWSLSVSRSGSHFTDYDYSYGDEVIQVEKKEVVVTRWLPTNN
jgi:hypothetical protein